MNVMKYYSGCLVRYMRGTRAVAAMEYAIVVGVIVVAVGAAMMLFQKEVTGLIDGVAKELKATGKEVVSKTGDNTKK